MTAVKRPTALGRGLSALLGDAPGLGGDGLRTLPIESLEPGPFQPRDGLDPAALDDLTASIRAHGLLQPILVRASPDNPGRFQIIGGERRWRAAQRVPLHDVPVLIRDLADRDAMAAALVENLQRQDLRPLEEALGFRRLLEEFGLTQDQLGEAVGKSRSHVANTLRLLGLSPRLRDLLQDGALSAGHARALLMSPDADALATQVVERGLNVRQTEALVAAGPSSPREPRDPETAALEQDLSARLGLKVTVRHQNSGGQVTLRYRTLDQLDGIVRLLNGG